MFPPLPPHETDHVEMWETARDDFETDAKTAPAATIHVGALCSLETVCGAFAVRVVQQSSDFR